MKEVVLFWLRHTGVNAAYAGAGAALVVVASSAVNTLTGAGVPPVIAIAVGGYLGTVASRVQAKVAPAEPMP